jgi:hypothetical protein
MAEEGTDVLVLLLLSPLVSPRSLVLHRSQHVPRQEGHKRGCPARSSGAKAVSSFRPLANLDHDGGWWWAGDQKYDRRGLVLTVPTLPAVWITVVEEFETRQSLEIPAAGLHRSESEAVDRDRTQGMRWCRGLEI